MSRENIDYVAIRERIKITRKTLGLSQEIFGRRIGCRRQDIHNVETGKRNPGLVMMTMIAVEYKLSLDWLVLGNRE